MKELILSSVVVQLFLFLKAQRRTSVVCRRIGNNREGWFHSGWDGNDAVSMWDCTVVWRM